MPELYAIEAPFLFETSEEAEEPHATEEQAPAEEQAGIADRASNKANASIQKARIRIILLLHRRGPYSKNLNPPKNRIPNKPALKQKHLRVGNIPAAHAMIVRGAAGTLSTHNLNRSHSSLWHH